jgi:hypothetical protein
MQSQDKHSALQGHYLTFVYDRRETDKSIYHTLEILKIWSHKVLQRSNQHE